MENDLFGTRVQTHINYSCDRDEIFRRIAAYSEKTGIKKYKIVEHALREFFERHNI